MIKLVDANLLIYAVNRDLPQHQLAREWLESAFSGHEAVGLPWVSVLAFLRLSTNARVFSSPLNVDRAAAYVDEWLEQPAVSLVVPGAKHWAILKTLLLTTGTAGNLTTDAHIAALALENGGTVCSADNDFRRYPGLRFLNPLVTLAK
jgi:toxin-antitoxin system PIN domain toxin